jgi:hypothetical protein
VPTLHMPRDLGTWGFILSITALLLMYPVGVLINLTSPGIRNWWAARSRKSLTKRIDILQRQLQRAEALTALSEFENETLWRFEKLVAFVGGAFHLLYGIVFFLLEKLVKPTANERDSELRARVLRGTRYASKRLTSHQTTPKFNAIIDKLKLRLG